MLDVYLILSIPRELQDPKARKHLQTLLLLQLIKNERIGCVYKEMIKQLLRMCVVEGI